MSKFIILDQPINGTGPHVSFPMGVDDYQARYQAGHVADGVVTAWSGSPNGAALNMVLPGPSRITRGTTGTGVPYVRSQGGPISGARLLGPHTTNQPCTLAAVVLVEQAGTSGFLGIQGGRVSSTADPAWAAVVRGQSLYMPQPTLGQWVPMLLSITADNRLRFRASGTELLSSGTVTAPPTADGGIYFGASTAAKPASAAEILYWDRELTKAERDTFHAYAQQKYGAV